MALVFFLMHGRLCANSCAVQAVNSAVLYAGQMNWGSKMLQEEVQEKQGGGKWRVGEEEFVLENLFFFLFKDFCIISMYTSSMEIVRKQGKRVLLGLRKYCIYREKERKHNIFLFAF